MEGVNKMSERPTPETDAVFIWEPFLEVDVNKAQKLCEKLERERDEARKEIDNIRKMLSQSGEAVGKGCSC